MPAITPAPPRALDAFLSQKLRFWSLAAMVCLVYVHAFNLHPRYLEPWTQVQEPLTWGNGLQYFLANGLLRFRIPILFAISGYLLARADGREPHRQRVRRRLRTLGVPYLLWSLLWLAALWGLEQLPLMRTAIIDAEISPFWPRQLLSEYTLGELVLRGLLIPAPFQLWFLRSLLVYNLAYPWLRKAILGWPRVYFSMAGLLWFFLLALPPFFEGEGVLFFGLGVWLAHHQVEVQRPPRWFRLGLGAALWLGAAGFKTWLAFRGGPQYGLPMQLAMLTLHKLSEAAGMLTAWFGLDALVRGAMAQRWVRWLAGFSFMIYVLHVPFVNYATEVALRYSRGLPHLHTYTYLLVPLLVIGTSVLLGALLRWLAPAAYAVLTGGRGLSAARSAPVSAPPLSLAWVIVSAASVRVPSPALSFVRAEPGAVSVGGYCSVLVSCVVLVVGGRAENPAVKRQAPFGGSEHLSRERNFAASNSPLAANSLSRF